MNDEQTSGDVPTLDRSDPTNAKLAALMVEQTRRILRGLARLERIAADGLPTPFEIANHIDDALREDAERETPKFSDFGRSFLTQLDSEIRCPPKPIERWARVESAHEFETADPKAADEPGGPVIEYTPVSWEEFGERINAALAKSAKKEREMTAMLDGVLAAGLLATTEKGAVAIALAKVFAGMIPDGEPIHEIPDGWAPVALAINPMTGDFITLAGPHSGPDGRVEPLETMLARQLQNTVASTIGAVREAGRRQPTKVDEYVVAGPVDEQTCEECRIMVGKRVDPGKAADYLRGIQVRCECENGCRLLVTHPDELA